jgi:rubrerythrin
MSERMEEALLFAIGNEIDAHDFYHSLAGRIANREAKEKLEQLAQAELGHRRLLEKRYEILIGRSVDSQKIMTSGELKKALERANLSLKSDVLEVVELAIKGEQIASDFYRKQGTESADQELKSLFLELSQEESRHKAILEREYKALVASMYWFEAVTSRPLED